MSVYIDYAMCNTMKEIILAVTCNKQQHGKSQYVVKWKNAHLGCISKITQIQAYARPIPGRVLTLFQWTRSLLERWSQQGLLTCWCLQPIARLFARIDISSRLGLGGTSKEPSKKTFFHKGLISHEKSGPIIVWGQGATEEGKAQKGATQGTYAGAWPHAVGSSSFKPGKPKLLFGLGVTVKPSAR